MAAVTSRSSVAPAWQLQRLRKELARGLYASQDDRDQPVDRGLGGQAASGGDGMEAVARELLRRDIITDLAAGGALAQQVPDEVAQPLLGSGDVSPSMQERRQLAAMMLVDNRPVGLEHRLQPLAGVASLVPDCSELFEVLGDLAFVPGGQDRFHVGEVLVQRRPLPVSAAIWDIVTAASPCSATSAAVVSRVASRTARRCAWMVSSHSLGTA
jgi:hypothetical protein